MAKFNHGALSRATNKLGGVVFQQYDGMQIGKEYQPNVKNPQTLPQMKTRSKFDLSSKFVSLWNLIIMLLNFGTSYKRFKRGYALRAVYRAVLNPSGDSATAVVSVQDAVNNLNTGHHNPEFPAPTLTHPTNVPTAQINNPASPYEPKALAEVVALDSDGKILGSAITNVVAGGAQALTLPTLPSGASAKYYQVMCIALDSTTEDGRTFLSNLSFDTRSNDWTITATQLIATGAVINSPIAYDFVELT